jgi:hypothetical protein
MSRSSVQFLAHWPAGSGESCCGDPDPWRIPGHLWFVIPGTLRGGSQTQLPADSAGRTRPHRRFPCRLLTVGFGPARFKTEPPACYRASWRLPGPDFHRQTTRSLGTTRPTMALCHGVTSRSAGRTNSQGWLKRSRCGRSCSAAPVSSVAIVIADRASSGASRAAAFTGYSMSLRCRRSPPYRSNVVPN